MTGLTARVRARSNVVTPSDAAWIAVLPCALVTAAAAVIFGPVLGRFMESGAPRDFNPFVLAVGAVQPEPMEHAYYVIGLAAPVLISAMVLLRARWGGWIHPTMIRVLVRVMQALAFAVVIGLVVVVPRLSNRFGSPVAARTYFTWRSIAIACLLAVVATVGLRLRGRNGPHAAGEPRWRPAVALMIASLAIGLWLLASIFTDRSIATANEGVFLEIPFWFDSAFAALTGQGPLVGVHALYGQLLPYAYAGAMSLFGTELGVFTVAVVSVTGASMLAVYALLRRVVRGSFMALALFLPFLATSFFLVRGTLLARLDPASLFSAFPERYAGAYVLAWLTARHLDGRPGRRIWALFFASGLVILNNFEFGVPAVSATVAALLWSGTVRSPRDALPLLRDAAIGLLAAAASVALFTLVVAGELPHFGWLIFYVKIFGSGYGMLRMPTVGIHLAIFLTMAVALVVATVRAVCGAENVVLTGMLAWSGIFGLGAAGYYVGQSHPENLIYLFSAWALALVLLVVVVVGAVAERASRLPTLPEFAVLLGFGLAVCSLAQVPVPWSQIDRIRHGTREPPLTDNGLERFIDRGTRPGEAVLLLTRLPHRIAYDVGVVDVVPYPAGIMLMPLVSQWRDSLRRLRAAHGHKIYTWTTDFQPGQAKVLEAAGFSITRRITDDAILRYAGEYQEWRDDHASGQTRHS